MMLHFWDVFNATETEPIFIFYKWKYFPVLNLFLNTIQSTINPLVGVWLLWNTRQSLQGYQTFQVTLIQIVSPRWKRANTVKWFFTHLFFINRKNIYVINTLWTAFPKNARCLWGAAKIVYFSALVPFYENYLFPSMFLRLASHTASVAQHWWARTWKSRLAPLYSENAKLTVSIWVLLNVARVKKTSRSWKDIALQLQVKQRLKRPRKNSRANDVRL